MINKDDKKYTENMPYSFQNIKKIYVILNLKKLNRFPKFLK